MLIYDIIHGYINISPLAKQIIDTIYFQRLRNIHQTGCLYLVFPSAVHTRFEHSIGTYHLAKEMITNIKKNQPELKITDRIVELVSIAGLCHDLGHLAYSHLFDDLILPKLANYNKLNNFKHHEHRSVSLLKIIILKYNININIDEYQFIADLILENTCNYNKWHEYFKIGEWIFSIISNKKNGIDVDKFDYLVRDNTFIGLKISFDFSRLILQSRVIDNELCYPQQAVDDIIHMFFLRYRLHRQIYNHKTVKAIELIIRKILLILDKKHNYVKLLLNSENNPEFYSIITDNIIYDYTNKAIKKLLNNLLERKLPILFHEIVLSSKNKNIKIMEEKIEKFTEIYSEMSEVISYKMNITNNKNKLSFDNIFLYSTQNKNVKFKLDLTTMYPILCNNYYEKIYKFYMIRKEKINLFNILYNNKLNNNK